MFETTLTGPETAPAARAGERMHDLVAWRLAGRAGRMPAVDTGDGVLDGRDLDRWADAVAAALAPSVRPGDRVALLFDRSAHAVVAMLALSRLGAAWVPLDTAFPADRIDWICADAGVTAVLTRAAFADRFDRPVHLVPDFAVELRHTPPFAPRATTDETAYVIYTSGTTGTPKGVPITHAALTNFVAVAAGCYGFAATDRVYQGLTIAFDYSVEELWVPLARGACLVPPPDGLPLVGDDLADFLAARRITALCAVPTLLATLNTDLPDLRLLLVSGEACPAELVRRWAPGRRMLNVYGPTETTVSATWSVLDPAEPVTIGTALPTYTTLVLDPATGTPVAAGQEGELAIGGVGLSPGYLGRPELTARAFVPAPAGVDVPNGRIYRTGDLVRLDEHGRIVSLGRIDSQVKVRGFRIELDEIESVLMAVPGIGQAAVTTVRPHPAAPLELAAFVTPAEATLPPDRAGLLVRLRGALPAYMVPSTIDVLDALPMLPSGKVDRKALPAPAPTPGTAATTVEGPADDREAALAAALATVLGLPAVDVTAHLFEDLGADSFSVARFCAALRRGPAPGVTTRLVYAHPSVRALAAALPHTATPAATTAAAPHRASRIAYTLTGVAQLAVLGGLLLAIAWLASFSEVLIDDVDGWAEYGANVAITIGALLIAAGVPVLLKRTLLRRATGPIPAWSPGYLRFWIVRLALRSSPVRLLVGSPLHAVYLRALGAKVGRHVLILSTHLPVFADGLTIGDDAVIGPDVRFDGYRMEGGRVLPGPITIGSGAAIGHGSHLDIDTVVGDGGRLAHASALLEGQRIPAGRAWHGSPAVDVRAAEDAAPVRRVGTAARVRYAAAQLLLLCLVTGPIAIEVSVNAVDFDVLDPVNAVVLAAGLLGLAWGARIGLPRALALLLTPGREYALYTVHWGLLRAIGSVANSPLLNELFGDSSAVVFYLRSIGVRIRRARQTGSNFGTAQRFDLPTWCSIGGGTLISDGLAMTNAEFLPHSFRVRPTAIGDGVFMGNRVVYPAGAAVGDDCLLATKVMVPLDGPVRAGVGLLGSPAFEVPRTVGRDAAFAAEREGAALQRGLRRKNRHNLVTGLLFLLQRFVAGYIALAFLVPADGSDMWSLFGAFAGIAVCELALLIAVDAATRGFRRLQPMTCSLYDARFWRHERYWKLADPKALAVLDGTPFKPLLWRLLGVRVGAMLLDDGATMPERSLVTIGDRVTLGARSTLHGHSLEDGVFKSGPIEVRDGATVGASALVHYGVELGAAARIAPDAFVMKGEHVGDGERWAGNPAAPRA